MNRLRILQTLAAYQALWRRAHELGAPLAMHEEEATLSQFREFIRQTPNCFDRNCAPAHLTGSALVVSPDRQQVLLTLHAKQRRWLPLGGHAEGESRMDLVAAREVREESGLGRPEFVPFEDALSRQAAGAIPLRPTLPIPLDLGRHDIQAHGSEPAHAHYDVRYLMVADSRMPLQITAESHDLRWFPRADAHKIVRDEATARLLAKLDWLDQAVLAGARARQIFA